MSRTIAERRFHNLGLDHPRFRTASEVVGSLIAVQAQDFGPAKWSVAMRTKGLDDAAMDRAVSAGEILRTHVLRPTWHFVLPADILWLQQLTAPRVRRALGYYDRRLGLDEATLKRCRQAVVRALAEAHLTRGEIATLLSRAGVVAEGQRLAHIVIHFELDGIVCSGGPKGKQQTYALVEERAPHARTLTRDESLYEFVRRYFTSHGPASARDLQAWSSLTMTDIKRGIELVGNELEHESRDGITYLYARTDRLRKPASPVVHLLQAYDEAIMGYKETRFWLDTAGLTEASILADRTLPTGVITIDCQFVGRWRRRAAEDAPLEVFLFRKLSAAEDAALERAARAHARYLGLERSEITRSEHPAKTRRGS